MTIRERPILFSAPMVRAILNSSKTQTRRVVKPWTPRPNASAKAVPEDVAYLPDFTCYRTTCPYGQPGQRLWVREAWARTTVFPGTEMVVYRESDNRTDYGGPWKPGIHMFRRDSRITLEITEVRVERLQDISDADAVAEGIERGKDFPGWYRGPLPGDSPGLQQSSRNFKTPTAFARLAYRALWDSINGEGSWDANPWVWAVSFKRVEAA